MRGPSKSTSGVIAVTISTGTLSASYWLLRRFRRRFNQSRAIRNGIRSRANAACLEVGDYVCLRGTVTAGARQLESPNKRVPCVAYRVVTVRVVDSRSSKKKASVSGTGGLLSGLSSVIPWLLSFSSVAQVDTEKWDTVYQLVSTRQETVEVYLEEDNDLADLEAMASAGTGKRRPRVRVDLGGAEFFSMEQISAEFQAETGSTAGESRTQLGYRTTEEVLAIGSKVMVLGEVGHDTEGAVGDVVLRKASPSSIFDLKTSSISRPFIVSTNTEQGLLQEVERSARIYFWTALPSAAAGLAIACWGIMGILAAIDEGSPSGSADPPSFGEGRTTAPRLRGLLGWRRT